MALYKNYAKTTKKCKVTFELPIEATVGVKKVALVGDFNNWDESATMMKRNKESGLFTASLSLDVGKEYQFRYLLDGERWENDWSADKYVPSSFGGIENSVVIV